MEKDTCITYLKRAVEISKNKKLSVKLNSAVDSRDATAIDVTYHKSCWRANVFHFLRRESTAQIKSEQRIAEISAKIEFTDIVKSMLSSGKVLTMAQIQDIYIKIRVKCSLENPAIDRKTIKDMLILKFPGLIEFHKPRKVNEAESVTFKIARDAAIDNTDSSKETNISFDDMDYVYKAAGIIRRGILKYGKWEFDGSFNLENNVPEELINFFRWVLAGPVTFDQVLKEDEVKRRATRLTHSTIYETFSQKQVQRRGSERFSAHRAFLTPQQVATGVITRRMHRDEGTINLLSEHGASVHYKWLLRLENRIANTVLEKMITNGGYFIPDDFVKGRYTFFAADNVDFNEDTPDGKRTLHGILLWKLNCQKISMRLK